MDAFTEKGLTEAGGDTCFFIMGGVVNDLGLGYVRHRVLDMRVF